jgi:hypothetical protein
MNKITKSPIYKFVSLANANSFVQHCVKPMWVMLGDDMRFWVVTPADAARLERAGYEFAG